MNAVREENRFGALCLREDEFSFPICALMLRHQYKIRVISNELPAPNMLMTTTTTKHIMTQTAGLTVLFQYEIKTAAAANSAGNTMTQLYQ